MKRLQMHFRTLPAFKSRLEVECLARRMSFQKLMDHALTQHLQNPIARKMKRDTKAKNVWGPLWEIYCERMPKLKVDIMVQAMRMDLIHYKSSRVKSRI